MAAVTVSGMVELMILSFGGHESPYYAGFMIVLVFIFGLLPLSFRLLVGFSLMLYVIYLLPILAIDTITNKRIFINNNIFMIAIILVGLLWKRINYKLYIKELSLEYDLSLEKEHLEDVVAERTQDLQRSEQRFRELFEGANDGIVVLDNKGVVVEVNHQFCELYGVERGELMGLNIAVIESSNHEREQQERMRRVLGGEAVQYETEQHRKNGEKFMAEVSSREIEIRGQVYIQSFHRDITDRNKLLEQVRHSQKMEAIGTLTGGIAHDFNNILSAVIGYGELLKDRLKEGDRLRSYAEIILAAGEKGANLTRSLLAFSRKQMIRPEPIDLNAVIRNAEKLLSRIIGEETELKLSISEGKLIIRADITQTEQVLMNLVTNARDAMPGGGEVEIKTDTIQLDEETAKGYNLGKAGRYALLSVTDKGAGMDEKTREKIFEPFFTTKEVGKGTGLGLAIVYGIVKQHEGIINVHSEPGRGTTFRIYLPLITEVVQKELAAEPVEMRGGNETVMLAEDNELVRDMMKTQLEGYGYTVIEAVNGQDALEKFLTAKDKISLLILDVVMPKMSGEEVCREARKVRPDIKVMFASGYAPPNTFAETAELEKDILFMSKPFPTTKLLMKVRELLDS